MAGTAGAWGRPLPASLRASALVPPQYGSAKTVTVSERVSTPVF